MLWETQPVDELNDKGHEENHSQSKYSLSSCSEVEGDRLFLRCMEAIPSLYFRYKFLQIFVMTCQFIISM